MKVYLNKDWSTNLGFAPAGTELVLNIYVFSDCPRNEYKLIDPITKEFIAGLSEMEILDNKNGMFKILKGAVLEGKSDLIATKKIDKVVLEEDYRSEKHFIPKGAELKPTSGPHVFALYDKDVLVTKIDMFKNTNPMFKAIYADEYYKFTIPPRDILMSGFIINKDRIQHSSSYKYGIIEGSYKTGLWFKSWSEAAKFLRFQECKIYVNQLTDYCNTIYPINYDNGFVNIGFIKERVNPDLIITCYYRNNSNDKRPILANAESGQLFKKLFDPKLLETFREMWFNDKF